MAPTLRACTALQVTSRGSQHSPWAHSPCTTAPRDLAPLASMAICARVQSAHSDLKVHTCDLKNDLKSKNSISEHSVALLSQWKGIGISIMCRFLWPQIKDSPPDVFLNGTLEPVLFSVTQMAVAVKYEPSPGGLATWRHKFQLISTIKNGSSVCIKKRCSSCQPVFQAAEGLLSPLPWQSAFSNKSSPTLPGHILWVSERWRRVAPGETLVSHHWRGLQFPRQPCPGLTAQSHTVPTLLVSRRVV